MFGDTPMPNRRMTPEEFEQELIIARIFQRPPCYFIKDKPTYPWVPKPSDQKFMVNFDLNPPQ